MTAVVRRRLVALVLLAAILMAEVTMGPGFCDPEHSRGGEGGNHRGVTR